MPLVWDFWLWGSGGSIPGSLGYALVAQGGSTATYEYSLVTAAVTSGPTFGVIDQGGAMCGNTTEAYHYPNNPTPGNLDHIIWATHSSSTTNTFSHGNQIQCTAAGNSTQGIFPQFSGTNSLLLSNFQLTFATNATAGLFTSNTLAQYGFQGIGGQTKAYFYLSSCTISTGLFTSGDGPPVPVSPSTFLYGEWWQTGAAANHNQALTQYMRTFSDVSFRSQLWTFSTSTAATGPTFAAVFPPETAHVTFQAVSNGVSGTSEAVFFEMHPIGTTASEVYVWASAAIVSTTAIPNLLTISRYHPVSGNSVPGYL